MGGAGHQERLAASRWPVARAARPRSETLEAVDASSPAVAERVAVMFADETVVRFWRGKLTAPGTR